MTSLPISKEKKFLRLLVKLQVKMTTNFLAVAVALIVVIFALSSVTKMYMINSQSNYTTIDYMIINPVIWLIPVLIWSIIFGLHLINFEMNEATRVFVKNEQLIIAANKIVIIIYSALLSFLIIGAVYAKYVLFYLQNKQVIHFLSPKDALLSFLIMWLFFVATTYISYMSAYINNNYLTVSIITLVVLIIVYSSLNSAYILLVFAAIMSVICYVLDYTKFKKVGE